MWRMHRKRLDPELQNAITRTLLRLTRRNELYWTSIGEKFRVAASGRWMFALKMCEFTELPALVAYANGSAIVLVCDGQESRAPSSTIMWGLLNLLDRQLPPHEVKCLAGEDGKSQEERFEEEIAGMLRVTDGETTIEAFAGSILRELWGR